MSVASWSATEERSRYGVKKVPEQNSLFNYLNRSNMRQTEKKAHILLVEDDINLSFLLVENLKAKGFEVMLKQSGKAALDAIRQHQFDLCIIDVMLPEVDGFTIAESLQRQGLSIPFLFLTARTQENDKLHGFELGAD